MEWNDPLVFGFVSSAVLAVIGLVVFLKYSGRPKKEEWQYFTDLRYELRVRAKAYFVDNAWKILLDSERRRAVGRDGKGDLIWSLWEALPRSEVEHKEPEK